MLVDDLGVLGTLHLPFLFVLCLFFGGLYVVFHLDQCKKLHSVINLVQITISLYLFMCPRGRAACPLLLVPLHFLFY